MDVPEFLPSLLVCGPARFLFFVGINPVRDIELHAGDGLVVDLFSAGARQLRNAKGREISLPPDQVSEVGDNILLERANRAKFCNESAMQFFERPAKVRG
jgi:hypothetical protein